MHRGGLSNHGERSAGPPIAVLEGVYGHELVREDCGKEIIGEFLTRSRSPLGELVHQWWDVFPSRRNIRKIADLNIGFSIIGQIARPTHTTTTHDTSVDSPHPCLVWPGVEMFVNELQCRKVVPDLQRGAVFVARRIELRFRGNRSCGLFECECAVLDPGAVVGNPDARLPSKLALAQQGKRR